MPYIAQEDRRHLDAEIDALAAKIAARAEAAGGEASFAGLLNYACTRLALAVVKRRFGKIRYWIVATVSGVFANVSDEFYRRLAAPYEDAKIASEGDVDLYQEAIAELK